MGQIVPSVPKLCPGGTVVCIGSGPSLTTDDVNYVRDKVDAVIAINTSYLIAPWATALYAADCRWWNWHRGAPDFKGLKYSLDRMTRQKWPKVDTLRNTGQEGLELDPTGLRTGMNSGYQAINLAVHFGASQIVLLGYDMQVSTDGRLHWHADHPHKQRSPYSSFLRLFPTLVKPLAKLGIEVVNCSRRTALECFPKRALEDVVLQVAA